MHFHYDTNQHYILNLPTILRHVPNLLAVVTLAQPWYVGLLDVFVFLSLFCLSRFPLTSSTCVSLRTSFTLHSLWPCL